MAGRDADRTAAAAALAGDVGSAVSLDDVAAELGSSDLVVNATPVGMHASPGVPFRVEAVAAPAVVVDLVYHPVETELVRACRAAGLPVANGLGMLVHQAAAAFELWTGESAPVDVMAAAALDQLA